METLADVLLYLARHVPAAYQDLADMERIIGAHPGLQGPAAAAPVPPGPGYVASMAPPVPGS